MVKKIFIINILIFNLFLNSVLCNEILIKVKLNNEIITNLDIENEKGYLFLLNSNLELLPKAKINSIAKNSLIREIIKKNEIKKFYNIDKEYSFMKNIEENFFLSLSYKSMEDLKIFLREKNLNYETIRRKLKIETLWNQIVYNKFKKNIKIDKENLRSKIKNEYSKLDKKYEYNLSEILFEVKGSKSLDNQYKEIIQSIKKNGFANTANIYGISDTSKSGGKLGWIKETQLSELIKDKIKKLNIKDITKPIEIPNGYLLLKLNDKKEVKNIINMDAELKQLIEFDKNRQLNQFSINYFKRLKQNTLINEY